MALVDRDTRARSEKNRYSRNRCDIRSPPSRRQFATYERIYAAAARGEGVSKSEPEGEEGEEKRGGGGGGGRTRGPSPLSRTSTSVG